MSESKYVLVVERHLNKPINFDFLLSRQFSSSDHARQTYADEIHGLDASDDHSRHANDARRIGDVRDDSDRHRRVGDAAVTSHARCRQRWVARHNRQYQFAPCLVQSTAVIMQPKRVHHGPFSVSHLREHGMNSVETGSLQSDNGCIRTFVGE
jgi:hypothetical protein